MKNGRVSIDLCLVIISMVWSVMASAKVQPFFSLHGSIGVWSAIMGVRGTQFLVQVEPAGKP